MCWTDKTCPNYAYFYFFHFLHQPVSLMEEALILVSAFVILNMIPFQCSARPAFRQRSYNGAFALIISKTQKTAAGKNPEQLSLIPCGQLVRFKAYSFTTFSACGPRLP